MNQNIPINIGIDASKAQLDIYVRGQDVFFSVSNDANGIRAAIKQIKSYDPERVIIEATGRIELALVVAGHKAGLPEKARLISDCWPGAASCWRCRRRKRTDSRFCPRRCMSA